MVFWSGPQYSGRRSNRVPPKQQKQLETQQAQVSKKRKHDERSHSNAVINFHLHGRESSLSLSGPSTSPSASRATQRSFQAPLLNRTPSPPSEKSHNEQDTLLPNGESISPSTSYTTPSQGILNPTPALPFEKSQPSISRESAVIPPSISYVAPDSSQNTLINSTPTPPFHGSDSSQQVNGKDRQRTRSERYESLLLGCKLGFPLWRPSPRCTEGGDYIPEIGGVGVHKHGLPFNTLFNITQARDSPANRDGIPEGVEPPCVLGPRAITIEKEYHLPRTTFIQPEGAILEQGVQTNNESSDSFTFHLSEAGGALLMVPHGGTLQRLEKTTEFKKRVQLHWRQWYDFAGEQVDLDDGQVLCLVTGIERCSTWAMAAWDSMSSYAGGKLGSLALSVDNHTGACSWAFPPARCSTQSSTIPATNGNSSPRETIFIRGFWIDGLIGGLALWSDTPSMRGGSDNSGSDSDARDCEENAPSSGGSSSKPLSSYHPSFSDGGCSKTSGQQRPDAPTVTNETQILEFNLDFLDDDSAMITNPCRVINKLAFEVIARTKPTLFDTGCAAFSHDEDWISIVNNSDEELPRMVEIIRRICLNFKFSIEGDTIHTVSLSDRDKELLEQREAPRQSRGSLITVLVVFAENDNGTTNPTVGVLVSSPSAYEDSGVRQQLATCSPGTTNPHVMVDPSSRLEQSSISSDGSFAPDDPTSEVADAGLQSVKASHSSAVIERATPVVSGIPPSDATVKPFVGSMATIPVAWSASAARKAPKTEGAENQNVTDLRDKIKTFLASQGVIKSHSGPSQRTQSHPEEPQEERAILKLASEGYPSSASESPPANLLVFSPSAEENIRHVQVSNVRGEDGWGGALFPTSSMRENHPVLHHSPQATGAESPPFNGNANDNDPVEGNEVLTLVEVKKGLARKSIEQLGFVKDINSLVVLSEASVTLYPLPGLSPPTVLTNAKAAFSFAVHSCVQHLSPDGSVEVGFTKPSKKSIPTLVTRLVVGCRRKVVIYCWKDGDAQEVKEYALPHSPRVISFIDNDHACFAYPANEYAIFSFEKLTATEVTMPLPAAGASETLTQSFDPAFVDVHSVVPLGT
ncbi:Vacuolar morphogenesis protein 6 [Marasmius sp. AFHP31]|nr:Vacuolar morphogenesis protein 6 [Marasmius sp. AFHP31]